MATYCETCKKPIPEGLTNCPTCFLTHAPDTATPGKGEPSDFGWLDLVNDTGDGDKTVRMSPDEEAAAEELVAEAVDEPADEELVAQVVDGPAEEELVAQVVDEPADEELVAE